MEPTTPVIPAPNAPEPEGQPVPPPQPQAEPEATAPADEPAQQPSAIANVQPSIADQGPSQASTEGNASTVPESWPGAFGAYKYSKSAIRLNVNVWFAWAILIFIVSTVLESILKTPGQIIGYFLSPLSTSITTLGIIMGVHHQKLRFGEAFSRGLKFWLKMLLLGILLTLSLALSFVLLIVPAFFVWPRLALANYFLVDKDMGVIEAYKASWHATKGNVGKLYGIAGANIAMALLFLTIIGIPFSLYFLVMYSGATAVLYEFVTTHPSTAPAA